MKDDQKKSKMERFKSAGRSFKKGWKHEFLSLEESLCHPDSERHLIDLRDPGVTYDRTNHTVTYVRADSSGINPDIKTPEFTHTVFVNPQFIDYMEKYAYKTRYLTDAGTPWLTRSEEAGRTISQEQRDDYYQALTSGPNQDVVMVSWRKTEQGDTGHSALSVGILNLADDSKASDDVPIYEFEPEISGSFYPSTTPLFRPGKLLLKQVTDRVPALEERLEGYIRRYSENTDWFMEANRDRLGGGDAPMAYSAGVMARDSLLPVGVGTAATVGAIVAKQMFDLMTDAKEGKIKGNAVEKAIKGIALGAIGYSAAKASGALDKASGMVLLKEEDIGSGVLASLVTPAQVDIMEHALYGMYQTYFSKYNVLSSNCADFADKMMEDIGLMTGKILEETIAMEDAKTRNPAQKMVDKIKIPEPVRPSRISYAFRNRKPKTGEVVIDGQKLQVSLVDVSGQSSVLIETDDYLFTDKLKQNPETGEVVEEHTPPIELFQKVLKEGVTIRPDENDRFHFDFQPGIKIIPSTQAASVQR